MNYITNIICGLILSFTTNAQQVFLVEDGNIVCETNAHLVLEEYLEVPITMVSTGPERKKLVVRN